ncbi:MAG: GAF domain-containing protein [Chloroflexi bacterium]|nr:GAF domain-containing protein [Chloroflexota bacterium]
MDSRVKGPVTASGASESLLRLQKIFAKLRWGVFVIALASAVYARQMGFVDNSALVKWFALAGLLGLVASVDEYLLRGIERWQRGALYGIAVGDWLVALAVWVLAPALAIQFPFIYFLPIIVASVGLGIPGGVLLGLLSSLALVAETRYVLGSVDLVKTMPWLATFVIAGGVGGSISQQWESTQKHIEATYRWIAELSAATTMDEVAEVVLRYLEAIVLIREAGGDDGATNNGSVALLTVDEDDDRCTAYAVKGISPEAKARLRVSTRNGLVAWLAREARPIWVAIEEEVGPLALPRVQELAHFRSCLVAPIRDEDRLIALGLAFSTRSVGQTDAQVRYLKQFSQQAAASLRKAMAYSQMERQFGMLVSVLERTRYDGQSDVKEVFDWVVPKSRELVAAETVSLAIRDKQDNLVVVATSGEGAEELVARGEPSRVSPSDWVLGRKSPLILFDYATDPRFLPREDDFNAYRSAVLVPLRIQDEVFGLLAAGSSERSRFSQNDLMVFIMLGQQVSLVVQEARLRVEEQGVRDMLREQTALGKDVEQETGVSPTQFAKLGDEVDVMMSKLRELWEEQQLKPALDREQIYKEQMVVFAEELYKLHDLVQGQEKEINEARQALEEAQDSTVLALVMGLERNYKFLQGSGERVAQLAVAIGHRLGCSPDEKRDLYYAGLLRDIGLMGVPPEILLLPQLDEEQMQRVRQHPVIGHGIVASFPFLAGAAVLVHHHHEWWDGHGYPGGLAGEEIPLGSRILAIADSFEALTSERSYRGMLTPQEALETMKKNAGAQFDPELCNTFVTVFNERRDIASWVLPKLSVRS